MATTQIAAPEWNEATDGYLGPAEISTSAPLHAEVDENVDPISYEVIRHALWNVNIEHGETILKVSGSPVALYSHDFNPAITTEDGELVYFGQYVQHLCAGAPLGVKWTLEHRADSPGIKPGDIYLTNDPWIACNHQSDVVMLKPVFWEGAIFAWITSTLHQYDLGGTTPGSFCPDAKDVYYEPSPIPPIKIVENDEIRIDVEEMVLRKSRLPDLVRLDLRAMIAGCNVAERRLTGLCEKYGAPTVKGAMKRISDNSEQVFLSRLRKIPDGIWRERSYIEMALPDDRGVYKIELSVTKSGDTLTFRNDGTDPQIGAINNTIVGFRGSIMTGLIGAFLHDQLFAYGGPMRHIEFHPTPGTLTCARYPGAVSCAPNISMLAVQAMTQALISKMIACSSDAEDRLEATAKFGASQYPILSMAGVDQWGGPFGTVLLDPMLSAIGAFVQRDGVSTGGYPFDPKAIAPNVEFNEQAFPILYLYRRELEDSAGAGRFRGGASAAWAYVPHGTEEIALATASSGVWSPTGTGMWGGGTGTTSRFELKAGSDVAEHFARRHVPQDLDELSGDVRQLAPKETGVVQRAGDALAMQYPGAGGCGDPFERDPALVGEDVVEGYVSVSGAERYYGVVVDADGAVDAGATERCRQAEFEQRRSKAKPANRASASDGGDAVAAGDADGADAACGNGPTAAAGNGAGAGSADAAAHPTSGSGTVELADTVTIVFDDGATVFSCQSCDHELGRDLPGYKWGAVSRERDLDDVIPQFESGELDEQLVQREHYCPACMRRLDAEIVRAGEASLADVEIWAPPA
jgi:N-methylhydantoinase B